MKKLVYLRIVNVLMVLAFLTLLVSILLYNTIPSDLNGNYTIYLIHIYTGMAFFVLGILHLILNWQWVKMNLLGGKKKNKG